MQQPLEQGCLEVLKQPGLAGALGFLLGALLSVVGIVLNNMFQSARGRETWLLDKRHEVYRATMLQVVRAAQERARLLSSGVDSVSDDTELIVALNMFRLHFSPLMNRVTEFWPPIDRYQKALAGREIGAIQEERGKLINFLEEVAAKAFGFRLGAEHEGRHRFPAALEFLPLPLELNPPEGLGQDLAHLDGPSHARLRGLDPTRGLLTRVEVVLGSSG